MHSESIPKQIIQLKGKVIHGEGRGGKIGFPTANIDFTATWLETGVYGVRIRFNGQKYFGVMNIGVRPTFHKNSPKNIEVHILNFNEVIYGISIQVEVLFKIRNEQKFHSVDDLKIQIIKDIANAKSNFIL